MKRKILKIILLPLLFFEILFFLLLILFNNLRIEFVKKENSKVLLIPQFGSSGGTRTYFFHLIDFFYKNKIDVIILLEQKLRDDEVLNKINSCFFDVIETNYGLYKLSFTKKTFSLSYFNDLRLFFRSSIYLQDIVLNHNIAKIFVSVASFGNFSPFLLSLKINYFIHSIPGDGLNFFYRNVVLKLLNKNKIIIFVSNFARNKIQKNIDQKVTKYMKVIHNFAEEKTITKTDSKQVVLTLGHLIWYKNPEVWLKVAQEVIKNNNRIEFIWAGDGPLLAEYQEKTKGLERINFIGQVKNVHNLYCKTIIYFQPSIKENHSLSILDAMSYKIPCLVSNIGGSPESIDNNKSGYVVDYNDENQMSCKIKYLLKNNDIRIKMGVNAYKKYNNNYTKPIWESKIKVLMNISRL